MLALCKCDINVAVQLVPGGRDTHTRRLGLHYSGATAQAQRYLERGGERPRTGLVPKNKTNKTEKKKNSWAAFARPIFLFFYGKAAGLPQCSLFFCPVSAHPDVRGAPDTGPDIGPQAGE